MGQCGRAETRVAGVCGCGGVKRELPRRRNLGGHIGKFKRDGLMVGKRFGEGLALAAVECCCFERRTSNAYTLRGDTNTAAFEITECNLIPLPLSAKKIHRRNAAVLEDYLTGVRGALSPFGLDTCAAVAGGLCWLDERD